MQSLKSLYLVGIIKRIVNISIYSYIKSLHLARAAYRSLSLLIYAVTMLLIVVIVVVNRDFSIVYYLIIVYLVKYSLR